MNKVILVILTSVSFLWETVSQCLPHIILNYLVYPACSSSMCKPSMIQLQYYKRDKSIMDSCFIDKYQEYFKSQIQDKEKASWGYALKEKSIYRRYIFSIIKRCFDTKYQIFIKRICIFQKMLQEQLCWKFQSSENYKILQLQYCKLTSLTLLKNIVRSKNQGVCWRYCKDPKLELFILCKL